jgi:transcriptional regulator with XRE-family HTH domain
MTGKELRTKQASKATVAIAQCDRHDKHGWPVMSLPERVKDLRKEHGWSQGELAERACVGADPAQISRNENGRVIPSADAIFRLTEVFERPPRQHRRTRRRRHPPRRQLHRRPRQQNPPQRPR